jgi:hypothetical protein
LALSEQKEVVVAGRVGGNEIKTFRGIVQVINVDRTSNPKRWRIEMRDQ